MIRTKDLPEVASRYWPYGKEETVKVYPPVGCENLPNEWLEKVGVRDLAQPYVYEIEDVHLYGPTMVGVKTDVILDTSFFGRLDLWERNYIYFEAAMASRGKPERHIPCAFSACNVWSGNYFHWILDTLPKIEALELYEQETGERPVILVDPEPPPFVLEILAGVDYVEWEPISSYHYHVDRLVVPTTRRTEGLMHPSAIKYLQGMVGDGKGKNGKQSKQGKFTSKKLYISRKLARTRRVVNEEGLMAKLLSDGYACVTPEKWSLPEQQAVFSEAEWVISSHGSGLANIVWGDGPKVIELVTPAYTNPCCWLIAAAMEWTYGFVMCEPVGHEDMRVSLVKLDKVCREMWSRT